MQRTIRPENDTLLVEVETKSGTISIEMKDADGNIIFSESDIATSSFEVDVPDKVIIRVEAENHKGGFSFYIYYPAHILILACLSNIISGT